MGTPHPTSTALSETWPELSVKDWKPTYHNLHMWTQIVGKVRLELSPRTNHWWNVPLYIDARGLTTSPIPYGKDVFEIRFYFIDHKLIVDRCDGRRKVLTLEPRTVADFYSEFMSTLRSLDLDIAIYAKPVEVADPIPFAEDTLYRAYDADAAYRLWRIVTSCDSVFKQFRARYVGKSSPVHFFWGSFDLAVTRFSGRRAPERPGADAITREGYSQEVINAGLWPGGGGVAAAPVYGDAAPEPAGFKEVRVGPAATFYSPEFNDFVIKYEDVRRASSPRAALLDFLQ